MYKVHLSLMSENLAGETLRYLFALRMARASSQNVDKLYLNIEKVVHMESSISQCAGIFTIERCHCELRIFRVVSVNTQQAARWEGSGEFVTNKVSAIIAGSFAVFADDSTSHNQVVKTWDSSWGRSLLWTC